MREARTCWRPMLLGLGLFSAIVLGSTAASAQTWVDARTTPNLDEIIAVDETGEPNWLFGSEDVAGDGPTFQQQEQAVDVRTVYAVTDPTQLWFRLYVSSTAAPGANISGYLFVDNDRDATTGGGADAPEINATFTTDPSPGGYEFVVGVDGAANLPSVWQWDDAQSQYVALTLTDAEAQAEVGIDVDPIRINADDHGYLQAMVELDLINLTQACAANFFVRSTHDIPNFGDGDLDVGSVAPCVPADSDDDGVPDIIVPEPECTTDAECPNDGICANGRCIIPVSCEDDADCPAGESCLDGRCVVDASGTCATTADCDELVCENEQCIACTSDGQCGAGRRCGPDGRCVDADPITDAGVGDAGDAGLSVPEGAEVQGGACTCAYVGSKGRSFGLLGLGLWLGLGSVRRWRRRARRGR